jgi:hypothetical protein
MMHPMGDDHAWLENFGMQDTVLAIARQALDDEARHRFIGRHFALEARIHDELVRLDELARERQEGGEQ